MRAGSAMALWAAAAAFVLHAGAAQAACARADGDALIKHGAIGLMKTRTTPVGSRGAAIRWVTVSGTSQMNGNVFVIDCRGAVRADAGLGFVEVQRRGPLIAGEPTLIANYHTFSGTGINVQNIAILQYRNGAIIRLWDHPSFEGNYVPGTETDETTYRWRFSLGGRGIEVTGRDVVLLGHQRRRHHYPMADHFCLNSKAMKYLPCH